jgi:antitoxin CptB
MGRNPKEHNRVEHEKLKWKCRRGLLELDIVLQRFLQKTPPQEGELALTHALLDLPDNDLWDIVAGRSENYEPHLKDVVARLRAA